MTWFTRAPLDDGEEAAEGRRDQGRRVEGGHFAGHLQDQLGLRLGDLGIQLAEQAGEPHERRQGLGRLGRDDGSR